MDSTNGDDWIDGLSILMDGVDYDTALEASAMVCEYETDSMEDFVVSSEERVRYVRDSVQYV